MLVFIEGGPEEFAGKAFESDVLLDHAEFLTDQYRWTPRTIQSTRFPDKVAQVWQHVSVPVAETPTTSPIPSAAENPNSTASQATTQEADIIPATRVPGEEIYSAEQVRELGALGVAQLQREAEASVRLDGETHVVGAQLPFSPGGAVSATSGSPEQVPATSQSAPEPDHTGETPDVLDGNEPLPDGEQLFLRRKRLKMTVQQVADQAGLARSKVDSIEKGTGKRIKAAEVLAVVKVLQDAEGPAVHTGTAEQLAQIQHVGGDQESPRE